MRVDIVVDGKVHHVHLEPGAEEHEHQVTVDDEPFDVHLAEATPDGIPARLNGTEHVIHRQGRVLYVDGERVDVAVRHLAQAEAGAMGSGGGEITPPMPGRIVEILVAEGDTVEAGETLLVLEAMKMQNDIQAPGPATVKEILVAEGDAVEASDVMIVLDAA